MTREPLPVKQVASIEAKSGVPWLVEGLWADQGVGLLCGTPKSCKTWLSLEIALSLASATPALGKFAVKEPGAVLLFAAEDSPTMVRSRLMGMAHDRGVALGDLPIHLVLAQSLRLEKVADQARLQATVAKHRPKLLVLDPFVRLTRIDENSSQEVSTVLAYLREMQRAYEVAILVVHHARKSNANAASPGMALRGSGDFWAWSDTNLYLSRKHQALQLAANHRSAPAPEPVTLELCNTAPNGPFLRLGSNQNETPARPCLRDRILDHLHKASPTCKLVDLRAALRVRMQTVVDTLKELENDGRVCRTAGAWKLVATNGSAQSPPPAAIESGKTESGSNGK